MNPQTSSFLKIHEKLSHPRLLDGLSNVQKIVCGTDHSFAIKANSEVFAWGNNSKGQLGIPTSSQSNFITHESLLNITTPTLIDSLLNKSIDSLSTGSEHTFAWSLTTGEVYGWQISISEVYSRGIGSSGKLGLGDNADHNTPQLLECFSDALLVGMRVCEIACGDQHTIAFVENREDSMHKTFVWGSQKNWQLGLEGENMDEVQDPHILDPDPFEGKIKAVSASNNYSCAVTVDGTIFTWGSGEFGRLGYETPTRQQKLPRAVTGISSVLKVCLGFHHAAAITEEGLLFTWGRGVNGQLGHGELPSETKDVPKQVKALGNKVIVDVGCGENHTIALTCDGEVFTWGSGQYGQLGHGDNVRQSLPVKVSVFDDKVVVQVRAGRKHSMILTKTGSIYVWGSNEFGQLGIRPYGSSHSKKSSLAYPDKMMSARTYSQGGSPGDFFYLDKLDDRITTLPDDVDNLLTFSPLNNHIAVQKLDFKKQQSSPVKKISDFIETEDQKFLKKRIKELELKSDPETQKTRQQAIYDFFNLYIRRLEEEFSSKQSDSVANVVTKNAKIDSLNKEFRQKIVQLEDGDILALTFCVNTFEKVCELKKKSNYAIL